MKQMKGRAGRQQSKRQIAGARPKTLTRRETERERSGELMHNEGPLR